MPPRKLSDVVWTPIRYVNLQFRDRRGSSAPFPHDRNRAEITVVMCEQKLYPVLFLCLRKIYPAWCEHLSHMWLSSLEITRGSFAPLQKSRRNHRCYVWTEALPGMIFVSAQDLSGIVWTRIPYVTLQFRDNAGQLRSVTEIAPKSPLLCVNISPSVRYGFRSGANSVQ